MKKHPQRFLESNLPLRPLGQSGSIFTILLAGIAMASALSLVLYQTISGPMASMARMTNKTAAKSQMQSVANIVIMDAANQADNGDCDGDGSVEPREWRVGTYGPVGGGLIPLTIGAPVTDSWGTDYGYCVWDVGASIKSVNGCSHDNVAANAYRLNGSPTPTTGNALSQTVIAVISAGPNRQFQTTCRNYANNTIPGDANTDVVVSTGDDMILRYTYKEAASATSGLWTLKIGDTSKAVISKDLEVGPSAAVTVGATSGLISATGLTTTGRIASGGAVGLSNESAVSSCVAANAGDLRYNSVSRSVEVCDGGGNWNPANPTTAAALSSITSATTAHSFDNANFAQTWTWNTLAGTNALTLSSTSTAAASNAQTLLNLALSGANGTAGQTTYGAQISNTHTGSGTNVALYTTASGGTNNYAAIFNGGNVGIGTSTPTEKLTVAGNILFNTGAKLDSQTTVGAAQNDLLITSADYLGIRGGYRTFIGGNNQATAVGALTVYANAADNAMTIITNGNVGIGTTTPAEKLSTLSADNTFGTNIFAVRANNLTQGVGIGYASVRSIGTNGNNSLFLDSQAGGKISLQTQEGAGGNVGIGTTTPGYKLVVSGVQNANDILVQDTTTAGGLRISINDSYGQVFTTGSYPLYLGTNGAPGQMIIATTGNVGIGTATPGQRLTVAGGGIGGNWGLLPNYAAWNAYGVGDGGAGIYNDNGSYQALMIAGNTSAGGTRHINMYDDVAISGNLSVAGSILGAGSLWTRSGTTTYLTNTGDNVGIGTTAPGGPLEVRAASNTTGMLRLNSAAAGQYRFTRYLTNGTVRWDVGADSSAESGSNAGANFFFNRFNDAGTYVDTPLSIIRSTGNVGIATSPSERLHVGGNAVINSKLYAGGYYSTGAGSLNAFSLELGGPAPTSSNGEATLYLHDHGDIAHQLRYTVGTLYLEAAGNGYGTSSTPNLQVGGSLYAAVNGGNVGIGTASPAQKLHVEGTAQFGNIATADTYGFLFPVDASNFAFEAHNAANTVKKNIVLNAWGGNVGIGSASPASKLTVVKADNATDAIAAFYPSNLTQGTRITYRGLETISGGMYLDAFTNNHIVMQTQSSGNVGIGTSGPTYKLDVAGSARATARVEANAGAGRVGLNTGDGSNAGFVDWHRPDSATRIAYMGWGSSGTNNLNLTLENSAIFNINGGNVGINTSAPGYRLDVAGDARANSFIVNGSGTWTPGAIYSDANWGMLFRSRVAGVTGAFSFHNAADTVNIMHMLDNGNVGIGTSSPGQKLSVAGVIESTSGGFKFPDGTVQTSAGANGLDYVAKAGDTMTGNLTINNTSPSLYLKDTDHTSSVLHQNGNTFYILSAPVNSTTAAPNGAVWGFQHNTSNDATTFGGTVYMAEGDLILNSSASNLVLNNNTVTSSAGTVIDGGGGWHRTYGNTGWYNGTYGGGWYMTDTTYVRAYNGKSIYTSANALFDGTLQVGGVSTLGRTVINSDAIEAQSNASGDRWSYIDFHSDDTYTDYGLRLLKEPGANSNSWLQHRGTGALIVRTEEAAPILFGTSAAERMRITPTGNVGIGTTAPSAPLQVTGQSAAPAQGLLVTTSSYTAGSSGSYVRIGHGAASGDTYGEIDALKTGGTALGNLVLQAGGGNLGIGTTAPAYKLDVNGDIITGTNSWIRTRGDSGWYNETYAGGWYMTDSSWIRAFGGKPVYIPAGFDTTSPSGVGCGGGLGGGYMFRVCGSTTSTGSISTGGNFVANGYLLVTGGVYPGGGGAGGAFLGQNGDMYMPWAGNWLSAFLSDRRIKENIKDMPQEEGLATIMKLRPVTFDWRDQERAAKFGKQIGFIAQEVEKFYPSFINTGEMPFIIKTKGGEEKVDKIKSIKYETMVVPLVKAVQELKSLFDADHSDIAELKADHDAIAKLKADNDNLRQEFEALKRQVSAARTNSSDHRLEKDIKDSDLGLDFVEKMRPVSFLMKKGDGRTNYGFIAQEVEQALDGRKTTMVLVDNDEMKTYRLKMTDIIAPVVKAIQQLADIFHKLEQAVADIVADLDPLKKEVEVVAVGVDARQRAIEEMQGEIEALKHETAKPRARH